MRRYAFSKKFRLLKREEYLRVQSTNSRFVGKGIVAVYQRNELGYPRIGITVSKKVGKSVIRNKIKRLIREAVRLHIPEMTHLGVNIIIIAKKNARFRDFHDMMTDLDLLVNHLKSLNF